MKKIAIVEDTGCAAREYFWSNTWTDLCRKNDLSHEVFLSWYESFIRGVILYNPDIILWRSGHNPTRIEGDTVRKDSWQRQTLEKQTDLRVIPNWNAHYFYENKTMQSYMFQIKKYPHPQTRIFYNPDEALLFLQHCKYPLVIKGSAGAGSKSTRFVFNFDEAKKQLDENFGAGLIYFADFREKNIFYIQEYIPSPGIWRIVMIGNDVGYSFYQTNKPGTRVASSRGFDSYPPTPVELLNLSAKINQEMKWQYMMYDYIWRESTKEWLILELTDTCAPWHSAKRKITHYLRNGKWENEEENTSPQELIFNKYVLEK